MRRGPNRARPRLALALSLHAAKGDAWDLVAALAGEASSAASPWA